MALGEMGMDIQSFYHLSPDEFRVVRERWAKQRDNDWKKNWEQVRLICYHSIRPYLKRSIKLNRFMPFTWDKGRKGKIRSTTGRKRDPKRFEMLKKKYGEKI